MKTTEYPAAVYNLGPLASSMARYNTQGNGHLSSNGLGEDHRQALHQLEVAIDQKPLLAHSDPIVAEETVNFLDRMKAILSMAEELNHIDPELVRKTSEQMEQFGAHLTVLQRATNTQLQVDIDDISSMFGVDLSDSDNFNVASDELEQWRSFSAPAIPPVLEETISEDEVRSLTVCIREQMFQENSNRKPLLYVEIHPQKHHLFWSHVPPDQRECAVPSDYSIADYLRFHCPHNDAHLAHLDTVNELSYVDYMDVRAFFEAAGVHAEWDIFCRLRESPDIANALWKQLNPQIREKLSADELQQWLITCRGYEFRLRTVRLLGDLLTLHDQLSFEEVVQRIVQQSQLTPEEVEPEVRKYYALTGLGATYTLGYQKLRKAGISKTNELFTNGKPVARTWSEFTSSQQLS